MHLCRRISCAYAFCLVTLYPLFLPRGGYTHMMEGKYHLFLVLSLAYALGMTLAGAWRGFHWCEPAAQRSPPTARQSCSAAHGRTAC